MPAQGGGERRFSPYEKIFRCRRIDISGFSGNWVQGPVWQGRRQGPHHLMWGEGDERQAPGIDGNDGNLVSAGGGPDGGDIARRRGEF